MLHVIHVYDLCRQGCKLCYGCCERSVMDVVGELLAFLVRGSVSGHCRVLVDSVLCTWCYHVTTQLHGGCARTPTSPGLGFI